MEGASAAYHIPFGLHLKGDLNRSALRRALDRIVVRHEVLRTTGSRRTSMANMIQLASEDCSVIATAT
jgi:hypothetical protein